MRTFIHILVFLAFLFSLLAFAFSLESKEVEYIAIWGINSILSFAYLLIEHKSIKNE